RDRDVRPRRTGGPRGDRRRGALDAGAMTMLDDSPARSVGLQAGLARLLTADEVETLPPPEWLVEGFMELGATILLYGESGAGKSLLALDIAACISAGVPWHGSTVRAGPVAYIAAEGVRGLGA